MKETQSPIGVGYAIRKQSEVLAEEIIGRRTYYNSNVGSILRDAKREIKVHYEDIKSLRP